MGLGRAARYLARRALSRVLAFGERPSGRPSRRERRKMRREMRARLREIIDLYN